MGSCDWLCMRKGVSCSDFRSHDSIFLFSLFYCGGGGQACPQENGKPSTEICNGEKTFKTSGWYVSKTPHFEEATWDWEGVPWKPSILEDSITPHRDPPSSGRTGQGGRSITPLFGLAQHTNGPGFKFCMISPILYSGALLA